uniref:Splicing factor n=1 Tax=Tanacetum cinerariifolium TaxID=118510 RepID=A0A6L2L5T9_TANCI|nr:splicing factor [Tanacetum cinerariifolium]
MSYDVDLINKVPNCRLWELSRVPCVHAMAGYMHLNKDPDNGNINEHQPPLPPIIRKMLGRPHKQRIKSPTEETTQDYYLRQDEQALRDHLEEEARVEQKYLDACRAEQEYEAKMDWMYPLHWQSDEESYQ